MISFEFKVKRPADAGGWWEGMLVDFSANLSGNAEAYAKAKELREEDREILEVRFNQEGLFQGHYV